MRTQLLSLLTLMVIPLAMHAISPPSKGVVVPDHLKTQMSELRKDYALGYWATHMQQQMIVREQLAVAGEAGVALATDTMFVPMLLGRYSNSTQRFTSTAFQQLLFDGPNPSGTVTQYYTEVSYGQFYFTGNAVGWFGAPRDFNYYVHDGGSRNAGLVYGGKDFTIDILVAADSTTDFSIFVQYFDGLGRGHVPQLGIVHTGAGAEAGADNIWSHRSNIRSRLLARKGAGDPYVNPARVTSEGWYITDDTTSTGTAVLIDGDYAIEPELRGSSNSGTQLIEIGVFAHEFGHILGMPDLYDTDGSSEGLGNWCLMAAGSWGGDGSHAAYPAHMCAWIKEQLGWVTPTVVTTFLKGQSIQNTEDHPVIFKLWKQGVPGNQYFLVENRQRTKFDQYLVNSGLLIFHVDNAMPTNQNENHYKVDLEQADGTRDLNNNRNRGDAGDPWPGSTIKRAFDGLSVPNSKDYTNAATYVGVRNISNSGMTMTADLDVGNRPLVTLDVFSVREGSGSNGNGRVEPGETATVEAQLSNLHPTSGSGLRLVVRSAESGAVLDTGATFSIAALGKDTVTIANALNVAPGFVPKEVVFTISAITPQDTMLFADTVVIGYPAILMVDRDSTTENIMRFYRAAVDSFGGFYETFRTQGNSFSAAAIDRRQMIIWFTGRTKTNTVPDSARQALTNFLDSGGSLFIVGQNVAEDLQTADSTFLAQMLHARWSKNITIGRTLYGDSTDFLGSQMLKLNIAGGDGASNQVGPDELILDGVAHPVIRYGSAIGTSYAGLWYESPASHSKLVFFGFGFEAINNVGTGIATRQQVMNAVLNWFTGVTSVPGGETADEIPHVFALMQNYPNPFNPATEIQFALPMQSQVRLTVYNVIGQEVARLVDGVRAAGVHRVAWNGTNRTGAAVSSGIYFYRLEANAVNGGPFTQSQFAAVRKMVVLR